MLLFVFLVLPAFCCVALNSEEEEPDFRTLSSLEVRAVVDASLPTLVLSSFWLSPDTSTRLGEASRPFTEEETEPPFLLSNRLSDGSPPLPLKPFQP